MQQARRARENSQRAKRFDCENKHSKMSCLETCRERNATRHLFKSSETLEENQIVQSEDPIPKISPLQLGFSSVEESASSSKVNPEVKIVKIETLLEITEELLMASYQARLVLQNVTEAVSTRGIKVFRRKNNMFRHVFKDLRNDRELRYFEMDSLYCRKRGKRC